MAAKKGSIINEFHKVEISKHYRINPKFKRTDLANKLGIPPLVVINYLNKYVKGKDSGYCNPNYCPITGFRLTEK